MSNVSLCMETEFGPDQDDVTIRLFIHPLGAAAVNLTVAEADLVARLLREHIEAASPARR